MQYIHLNFTCPRARGHVKEREEEKIRGLHSTEKAKLCDEYIPLTLPICSTL